MNSYRLIVCMLSSITWLSLGALGAADQNLSPWPPLPETMLRDAQASMFFNRPHELMDSLEKSATEAGVTIDPVRDLLASRLYRMRELDGVDLDRPAMFLWRKGRAPLLAIVPIKDRDAFLKSFGRVRVGDTMLIRVGENQGTTVFKQNTEEGMIEYRLLIRDQTAFLGRSAAECNLLSEIKLQEDPNAPMFSFYIDRPYDFLPHLDKVFGPSIDPLEAEIKSLISSEYDLLLQQMASVNIAVSVDVKQVLSFRCTVVPQKESTLALWAVRQQNQSSRLLSLLDFNKSSLAIYGNMNWAGGIKETGTRIAKFIERYAAEHDTGDVIAKALAAWAALADRQAAFAQCVELRAQDSELMIEGMAIHEQARARELLTYQQILEKHLSTKKILAENASVGDLQNLENQQVYWKQWPAPKQGQIWRQMCLATDAHLFYAWGVDGEETISKRSLSLIDQLDKSVSPIGEAGVVVVHIKLHNLLREISNLSGSIGYKIEETDIIGALRLDNERNLVLGVDVSLPKAAQSIRASDWSAVLEKLNQLVEESLKIK